MPIGFGAVIQPNGVNFSIYSRDAAEVNLVLFESENAKEPSAVIKFDPVKNKTGDVWHIFIEGLKPGALYLYKVDGPYNPPQGLRFNKNKYL